MALSLSASSMVVGNRFAIATTGDNVNVSALFTYVCIVIVWTKSKVKLTFSM